MDMTFLRSRVLAIAILLCALAIQVMDTAPLRAMTREAVAASAPDSPFLSDPWWKQQIQHAEHLYLFPTFGCGVHGFEVVPVQWLAAFNGVPFNTGLIARGYSECARKESVLDRGLEPGNLYIFLNQYLDETELSARFGPDFSRHCQSFSLGHVCIP